MKKKKAPKRAPRAKQRLSAADLKRLRTMLLERRREILGDVNEMESETLKKSRLDATGDLSSMPIHMADVGTDNYEQEFALGLMGSERKLIEEIDAALNRMENGKYGLCEGTGKPIPLKRLQAQPWARYCVEYARMIEKGQVAEKERGWQ
jgi:RNA polymerase-binding protein DksA